MHSALGIFLNISHLHSRRFAGVTDVPGDAPESRAHADHKFSGIENLHRAIEFRGGAKVHSADFDMEEQAPGLSSIEVMQGVQDSSGNLNFTFCHGWC